MAAGAPLHKSKITLNCEERGIGTHTDCHGWVNPGCEVTYCECPCHVTANPPWDYLAERERVWGKTQ